MSNKITIEEIQNRLKEKNWNLISDTYTNLKTNLEIECPEGHRCFLPYSKIRKGNYDCPICKQNQYHNNNGIVVKKKGYRILALDQASITTGWAIFDNKELVKFGSQTTNGYNSVDRIAKTKSWVASMIENWKPDSVVIEDIQLQKFKSQSGLEGDAVLTYKKLAHLQGVLENYFYEKGLLYQVVPPATWRTYSQIKGVHRNEKKKSAQMKVKQFYDISIDIDSAEAVLIGRWAANNNTSQEIIMF